MADRSLADSGASFLWETWRDRSPSRIELLANRTAATLQEGRATTDQVRRSSKSLLLWPNGREPPGAQFLDPGSTARADCLLRMEALARVCRPSGTMPALEGYLIGGLTIPPPDTSVSANDRSTPLIAVRQTIAARAILFREMTARGVSQAELGRSMKRDEETVRRIIVRRDVSLNLTLKALAALGVVPALAI